MLYTLSMSLTWELVRAWRLSRHYLDQRVARERLMDVVRDVCGFHAQVQSSVELQMWARVDDANRVDITEALWTTRELVRTWTVRGTLHVLTAADLPLYVSALSQHDRWRKGAWQKMIGMPEKELKTTLQAIRDSLGAVPVTREELAAEVAERTGDKGGDLMLSGWGEMLKPAAFHGYLCSGPPRGQSVTFVRPDRWLGHWKALRPEEAWREIVRRYLGVYGPANRDEFARWWGMQPAPAGRVLKASEDQLTQVDIEGHRAWALTADLPLLSQDDRHPPPRLLPAFDVYVAGTRPRLSLVNARFEELVFRKAGWVSPVLLVDGLVAGVWSHERKSRKLEVTVKPFARLPGAHRRAITAEADDLGRFLDAAASTSFSRPD
jgi:hypothetical protein